MMETEKKNFFSRKKGKELIHMLASKSNYTLSNPHIPSEILVIDRNNDGRASCHKFSFYNAPLSSL